MQTIATPLKRLAVTVALAMSLLWPAFVNGGPFWFPDTSNYIRAADAAIVVATGQTSPWSDRLIVPESVPAVAETGDRIGGAETAVRPTRTVLAGRSIYYGALLATGTRIGGPWAAIAIQSLLVAGLLVLCAAIVLRAAPPVPHRYLALGALILVGATPLAFHTSMLMPDIFAGVLLLTAATLMLCWRHASRLERVLLFVACLAMVTFHTVNLLLALVIGALAVVAFAPRRAMLRPALLAIALVTGGFLAEAAFNTMVRAYAGVSPLSMPFLSARITAAGPGRSFLAASCADQATRFELCRWQHQLGQGSDNFLWSGAETGLFQLATPEQQRRMSQQDKRFFLAVAAHDPLGVAKVSLGEGFAQLGAFRLKVFNYSPPLMQSLHQRHPPAIAAQIARSPAARGVMPTATVERLTMLTTAAGLLLIAILLWRHRGAAGGAPAWRLALLLIGSVIANGLLCGALSGVHDRYQMRVVWLVPLCALLVLALIRRSTTAPPPAAA